MSSKNNEKTPEQLAEERRQDVMAYAFRDKDGKLYSVNAEGDLQEAPAGIKELSPAYQAMANKTAALALFYRRIENLNPEEQQSLIARITGKVDGASKDLSVSAQAALDEFKVSLKDFGIKIPGEDTVNFLGQVYDGMALPINLVSETFGSITGVASRLFTKELSRDEALAIGTAYASARQAAVDHHPKMDGIGDFFSGLFSKHFGSFASAGFFQLLDWTSGFFEAMPGIGDWVKKQGWHDGKSFTERLNESMIGDDTQYAKQALAEFKEIGGQNAGTISKLLVDGGKIETQAGESVNVGKDEKTGAPTVDKQKGDVDAQEADNEENKQSWLSQKVEAFKEGVHFDKTAETLKNSPVSTVAGVTFTGQMTRGVAEGVARGGLKRAETAAEKAAKEAKELKDAVKAMKKAGEDGHKTSPGWKFWDKTTESREDMVRRLDKLKREAADLDDAAKIKKALAGDFTKEAMEDVTHSNFIERVWDKPRKIGRWIGDKAEGAFHSSKENIAKLFGKTKSGLGNAGLDMAAGTATGANEVVGAVVVAAEENPTLMYRVSKFAGKWGSRAFAYLAPAVVVGEVGNDIANKDVAGGVIHSSELAGIGTAMYKLGGAVGVKGFSKVAVLGAKRATPYIAPIISGGELAYSITKGDKAGMVEHGTELGTIASFAAAGAAIGAPVGGVGAIPGALIGATVGGIASIFTGWGARAWYESGKTAEAAPQKPEVIARAENPAPKRNVEMDKELSQVALMEMAKAKARQQGISFIPGVSNQLGAVVPGDVNAPKQTGPNPSQMVLS